MAKAEEKTRAFNGGDSEMIQTSRVIHGLFIEDKPSFISFDVSFADPFAENWLQKINVVSLVNSDSLTVAMQMELTKKVADKMEECKVFFQQMKYFIEKAFPGKREIWTQFGYSSYDDARRGETKMIQFYGILGKTAAQYSAKLIAAGFSQEDIDKITTLHTELTNADYEQEISKKKRPAATQERIEMLNECYEYMKKVSRAGKIIFANDYVKYNQYLLPDESSSKKEEPAEPPTT